jgi:hypothetical protein
MAVVGTDSVALVIAPRFDLRAKTAGRCLRGQVMNLFLNVEALLAKEKKSIHWNLQVSSSVPDAKCSNTSLYMLYVLCIEYIVRRFNAQAAVKQQRAWHLAAWFNSSVTDSQVGASIVKSLQCDLPFDKLLPGDKLTGSFSSLLLIALFCDAGESREEHTKMMLRKNSESWPIAVSMSRRKLTAYMPPFS